MRMNGREIGPEGNSPTELSYGRTASKGLRVPPALANQG